MRIFIILITFIWLTLQGLAQGINVEGQVLTPLSNPVPNLLVKLDNGILDYYFATDTQGKYYGYDLEQGDYTLTLLPSWGGFPGSSRFQDSVVSKTLSTSKKGHNPKDNFPQLGTTKLVPFPIILTINAISGADSPAGPVNSPINGLKLEGYRTSGDYRNVFDESTSDQVVVGFLAGDNTDYELSLTAQGFVPYKFLFNPGLDPLSQTVPLLPTNADINIQLVDAQKKPYLVPTGGYASVDCDSAEDGLRFSSNIPEGSYSTSFPVKADSYQCNVYVTDFPSTSIFPIVAVGEVKNISVTLQQTDATLTVFFVDQAGVPYFNSPEEGSLFCESLDKKNSFSTNIPIGSDSVTLDIVAGTLKCSPYLVGLPIDPFEITVAQNSSAMKTVTAYTPDANLTIKLVDSESNLPIRAKRRNSWMVSCSEQDGSRFFSGTFGVGKSSVTLPVVAGTYYCYNDTPGLLTSYRTVTVPEGQVVSVDLPTRPLDSRILFSLKNSDGTDYGIPNSVYASIKCYSFESGGGSFTASLEPGATSSQIDVVAGSYQCSIFGDGLSAAEVPVVVDPESKAQATFVFGPKDRTLTVNFLDTSGNARPIPDSVQASLACYSNKGFSFQDELQPGSSQLTLQMAPAAYHCDIFGQGIASRKFRIDLSSETSTTVDIRPEIASTTLTVNFIDGHTSAELKTGKSQYANISCYQPSNRDNGAFFADINPDSSSVSINLAPGRYECNLNIKGSSSAPFKVKMLDGNNTTQNALVFRPNSKIIISLIDAETSEPFTLPVNNFGSVGCQEIPFGSKSKFFSGSINQGDSTVEIPVRAGNYECNLWLERFGSTVVRASVSSGDAFSGNSRIFRENAQLTVKVIDSKTGSPVTDQPLDFSVRTAAQLDNTQRLNHSKFASSNTGEATFLLLSGQYYEISVSRPFDQASRYVLPDDILVVLTDSNQPKTAEFLAVPSNTFIEISATTPEGSPLRSGWINAFSSASSNLSTRSHGRLLAQSTKVRSLTKSDSLEDHWVEGQVVNGNAKIAVIPGRTYEVVIYPDWDIAESWLPPQAVTVTPQEGETIPISLAFSAANLTLSVGLVAEGGIEGQTPYTHCYAIDQDGRQSYANGFGADRLTLPLFVPQKPVSIDINCSAYYENPGAEYGINLWGQRFYVPSNKRGNANIDIIVKDFGRYYPQDTYTFDATKGVSFTLQDGKTRIDIPAQAVASSGDVTMLVGSGTGYSFKENSFPILTYDISFVQGDKQISSMSKPVTLSFPIDLEKLSEFKVDPTSAKAASFESGFKVWRHDASYAVDYETNRLSVTVSHFSIWGLLIDLAKKVNSSLPEDLSVKKLKKRKSKQSSRRVTQYQLCWEPPASVEGSKTKYQVQLLTPKLLKQKSKKKRKKKGKKKRSSSTRVALRLSDTDAAWERAATVRTAKTCIKRDMSQKGEHHFRVRVKGREYSTALTFKAD